MIFCFLVKPLTIFLVIEILMKMSCILRVAEESLLIPVCFSESRGIIIIKCLCPWLEVAVSEFENFMWNFLWLFCGVYQWWQHWDTCLANKILESFIIRLFSGFLENNAEFIVWLIWMDFIWVQNIRAYWSLRYFSFTLSKSYFINIGRMCQNSWEKQNGMFCLMFDLLLLSSMLFPRRPQYFMKATNVCVHLCMRQHRKTSPATPQKSPWRRT